MDNLVVSAAMKSAEDFSRSMRLHVTLGCERAVVMIPAPEASEVCDLIDEALAARRERRSKPKYWNGFGTFYFGFACGAVALLCFAVVAADLVIVP